MAGRDKIIRLLLQVSVKGITTAVKQINALKDSITGAKTANNHLNSSVNTTTTSLNRQKKAVNDLNAIWGSSEKSVKKNTSALGGFINKVGTAISFIGRFAVAFAAINAVQEVTIGSIRAFTEFEAALKDLQAIAGTTSAEAQRLGEVILDTAGNTKFFADELAEASKNLLRLGFTSAEVEASLEGIALLSQATGESLNVTAELVAKTINAFGLSAGEAFEIANSFTTAINKSALSIEFLGTSLQYAAPLARQLGVSLNETTGLLSALADSGFKASRAGTGLRQVLLKLGSDAGSVIPILEDLEASNLSVADAEDLVGQRAAAQLLVLVENIDGIRELVSAQEDLTSVIQANITQLSSQESAAQLLAAAWQKAKTQIGEYLRINKLVLGFLKLIDNEAGQQLEIYQQLDEIQRTQGITLKDLVQQYRDAGDDIGAFTEKVRQYIQASDPESLATFFGSGFDAQDIVEYIAELENQQVVLDSIKNEVNETSKGYQDQFDELKRIAELEGRSSNALRLRQNLVDSIRDELVKLKDEQQDILDQGQLINEEDKIRLETINRLITRFNQLKGLSINVFGLSETNTERKKDLKSFEDILSLQEELIEAESKRDVAKAEKIQKALDEQLDILVDKGLLDEFNSYVELQIESEIAANTQSAALEKLTQRILGVAGAAKTGAKDVENFITDLEKDLTDALESGTIDPQKGQALLDQLLIIYADFLERRDKLDEDSRKKKKKEDEKADKERQKLEEEIADQAIESAVEVANTANDAILDSTLARLEAERNAVQARFDYEEKRLKVLQENGVINEDQYARELEKIKKQQVAAENEILEKQFEAKKKNTITEIIIDTAQAVAASLENPILAAIIGASGLAQIQIVRNQKFIPTQFAEGGIVEGRSHAQGGVPFTVRGEGGYEMEGGEFIVNKRATAMHRELLESINSYGNAKYNSNMFAAGGVIPQSGGGTRQTELLEQLVALNSTPVRAYVSEDELVRTSKTRIDNDIRSTI